MSDECNLFGQTQSNQSAFKSYQERLVVCPPKNTLRALDKPFPSSLESPFAMKAVCVHETGDPEVLLFGTIPTPEPNDGEDAIDPIRSNLNQKIAPGGFGRTP